MGSNGAANGVERFRRRGLIALLTTSRSGDAKTLGVNAGDSAGGSHMRKDLILGGNNC